MITRSNLSKYIDDKNECKIQNVSFFLVHYSSVKFFSLYFLELEKKRKRTKHELTALPLIESSVKFDTAVWIYVKINSERLVWIYTSNNLKRDNVFEVVTEIFFLLASRFSLVCMVKWTIKSWRTKYFV